MDVAASPSGDLVVVEAWSAPREVPAARAGADLHAVVMVALFLVAVLAAGAELAALALVRAVLRAMGELLAVLPRFD